MGKKKARAKKRDLDEVKDQAGSDESEDQVSDKGAMSRLPTVYAEPKKSKQGMLAFGGPQKHVPGSRWG